MNRACINQYTTKRKRSHEQSELNLHESPSHGTSFIRPLKNNFVRMKNLNFFNYLWYVSFLKPKRSAQLLFVVLTVFWSPALHAQTRFKSLNYLYSISGNKTIAGQHNDQKDGTGASTYTEKVNSITGKYPGLWSGDFLFSGDSQLRWDITYEAEQQWNKGAIINMMWHCCPPTQNASCNWDGGVLSNLTYSQWSSLLTNGSSINQIWKSRMDEIAPFLQYLKDKGVEVMFRPLHEQNQSAFWWGGKTEDGVVHPDYTKKLYQLTHDYFVNTKGLTNLIWIWDVQDMSTNFGDYNPGDAYWDVAALDVYSDGYTNMSYYNALVAQAGNKPIAIGECGNLPDASVFQNQPRWVFFMNWSYLLQQNNTDQTIKDVYNITRVLTRDEMPGWNSAPANLATSKPVTVSTTEAGTNIAANATDGNYGTRWSSAYSDPQWIYVDLGANYDINQVKITWETAYATAYQIQISSDAANWTTVKAISGNTALINDNTGLSGTGRYVRIYGTARATKYGYSIYELEVYGTAPQTPFGGTAWSIPGKIEAEDYDIGGEGVAFHDLTPTNTKGEYRPNEAVDIQTCAEGGYNLADVQSSEWVEYTVNVTTAGPYTIQCRVAAITTGKTFHIELDGQNISGTLAVPNTGEWQTWTTISAVTPAITVGKKIMRIVMDAADYFNLNWVQFTATSANLALNQTASASSTETAGFEPYKAFDGDATATRWSSSYANNQWISVDLGSAQNISRVVLKWETAYASSYRIETSSDNVNWTIQKTITSGAGGTEDSSFPTVNARYVRMYGLTRATQYGFSLWEFEVYGSTVKSEMSNPEHSISVDMDAYPNPAIGNLTVAFKGISNQGILKIYNITGRTVYTSIITKDTNIVQPDISKWAKGIYIISLKSKQEEVQKKIIVK